jgi:predicted cation transporter
MEYDSSSYHRSNPIHTILTPLILIIIILLLLLLPSYHHRVASSALLLLMRVVASTTCDRYSCFLVTGLLFRIACRANNSIVNDDHHSYS